MISIKQYEEAVISKEQAEKIINQYLKEKRENFEKRLKENPIFTDDELFYSRTARCSCGAGLAYPKDCGPFHYWDCSAILKGIEDKTIKHTDQLPFIYYEIKGENDEKSTRPKK